MNTKLEQPVDSPIPDDFMEWIENQDRDYPGSGHAIGWKKGAIAAYRHLQSQPPSSPVGGTGDNKCTCGVPIELHNTSCRWENATFQIDENGIIITEGHPLKGKHFNMMQSTAITRDKLLIQSLQTENAALIKEVEAWKKENFYNIEQAAKTERAREISPVFVEWLDKEISWNWHLNKSHSNDPISKARVRILEEVKKKYLSIPASPAPEHPPIVPEDKNK